MILIRLSIFLSENEKVLSDLVLHIFSNPDKIDKIERHIYLKHIKKEKPMKKTQAASSAATENGKGEKRSMLEGSPGIGLFLFALPMILGNLFQQFYNMTDSIIVGRFVGEDALAAVGASYSLTNVFVMIAIGGGIGASVITSQYLGAGRFDRMKTSVYTALITFLGVGIFLGAFGFVMNRQILIWLNTPENILDAAGTYLGIYFLGMPFLFMYNILSSMFNALGDSRTPLGLLIFSSVLNVVLDLWFVLSFGLAVAGVAIATVMAQGLAAILSFLLLMRRLKGFEAEGRIAKYDTGILASMVRIAIPSILQQSIVSIGMLLVQSVVNGFGSSVLAGYSAGTRIESICIVPMISTGNAVSTFTAQNMGARKPERVKAGYRAAWGIVAGFGVVILLILSLFGRAVIGAFLDTGGTGEAFETGYAYLSFLKFFFVCIGLKAITDGVLRGAGDVVVFTCANLVNLTIRVAGAFLLAPVIGVAAVWYAVPAGWTVNFLISFVRYLTGKWSRRDLVREEPAP